MKPLQLGQVNMGEAVQRSQSHNGHGQVPLPQKKAVINPASGEVWLLSQSQADQLRAYAATRTRAARVR